MTRKEAVTRLKDHKIIHKMNEPRAIYISEALDMAIKALDQEPCEDAVSRQAVIEVIDWWVKSMNVLIALTADEVAPLFKSIHGLPPVTPQEPRKGNWLRMSDLSEWEDDRYKCSRCGNVVHYTLKKDLYTFNRWCGRCGSDNGKYINYEVEE